MKLAICSDIHLEFGDLNLINTDGADVLVLAGDIMLAQPMRSHPPEILAGKTIDQLGANQKLARLFREFLSRCSAEYPHVVMIAGNHEFYEGKWNGSLDTLIEECSRYSNIHFLEQMEWRHEGTTFLGATIWTSLNGGDPFVMHQLQNVMNDYSDIRNDSAGYTKLRPAHTLSRHRQTVSWLKKVLAANPEDKIVVVGHHAPTSLSIDSRYISQTSINYAYYTDLSELILDNPQIKLWIHGHTHVAKDYMVGPTRVVCNPRGYVGYERLSQEVDPYHPLIIEV